MPLHCMIFWLPRYINCLLDLEKYARGLGLFVRRKVLKSSEKTIPVFKDY